jgi:DNA polymerase (family 10)
MNKNHVIQLLEKIALYLELKAENPFKISAFRKAAAALENDNRSLSEIEDITAISGIGKGTASLIEEFLQTGKSSVLEELENEVPKGLLPLLKLPGLGGKKIAKLYHELGVESKEDLTKACEEHQLLSLSGFGKKTEENILKALKEVGERPDRLPIAFVLPIAQQMEKQLQSIKEIKEFSLAGSLRRMRETVKDLDFIISTEKPSIVKEKLLEIENKKEVIAAGETKVSLTLSYEYDISIDFRIVEPHQFTTTLHHFTGSKDHNIRMRQIAKERGEKISEYGVEMKNGEMKNFSSEEAFFEHFDLPIIPPEMREDGQEIDFIKKNAVISLGDIKGDLHMHTTASDGAYSIEEMVEACRAKGYQYMAITDHSKYLKVANGLTPERLREQIKEIKRVNQKYDDIEVLSGVEMDILPDGRLDYDDDLLSELDIVIASIHSSFSQTEEEIMKRLNVALENPHVNIIAHPTGRLIGRRKGYQVNIEQLIEKASKTGTVLELNANPQRLDLSSEHIKLAQKKGVKIVINTDAHAIEQLEFMKYGVGTARKGWIQSETCINSWNLPDLLSFLKKS